MYCQQLGVKRITHFMFPKFGFKFTLSQIVYSVRMTTLFIIDELKAGGIVIFLKIKSYLMTSLK